MALTQTQVSQLYVSIFNRASEGNGNTYWQSGADLATVATQMLATTDAATYFGSSLNTNQAFVEHIYLNTLNKTLAQDPTGIAYWVAELDSGVSRGQMVANLVTAATLPENAGAAQDQFNNRVTVSNYMADTVAAAPTDYATSTSFSSGLTVTDSSATVTTAKASVNTVADTVRSTPTYTITADAASVTEGNNITFTVTASEAYLTQATTLNYQIAGVEVAGGTASPAADLGKVTGTVTIAAGATTGTFTLSPTDDGVTEGYEGFKVSILDSAFTTVATSGNVVIMDGATAGQTFSLTTSTDTLAGTTGNDTYNAVVVADNATGTTLQPGDTIAAGAGTDTLNISISGAAAGGGTTTQAFQATNLEKVLVSNFETAGNANTIDLTLVSGLTTVGNSSSAATGDTTFTGVNAIVDAEMKNGAGDVTITYGATAVAGTADVQALAVSNTTAGTFTANGTETINVTTSTVNSVLTAVASNALKTLNVAGDKNLEITTALDFASNGSVDVPGAVVNASTMTGKLTITTTANEVLSLTGGTNDDTFNLGSLTTIDTVNGGAGTDTVAITVHDGDTTYLKVSDYTLTNVEQFQIEATNAKATKVDLDGSTITKVIAVENNTDAKAIDIKNAGANATVQFNNNVAGANHSIGATSVLLKDASGTADVLNVILAGTSGDGSTDGNDIDSLTLTNVETLNINSTHLGTTAFTSTDENVLTSLVAGASLTTLNLTGSDKLQVTVDTTTTNLATVNASAMTANTKLTLAAGNVAVTMGSGDDTIVMGTTLNNADTIVGGAQGTLTTSGDTLTATVTNLTATTGALHVSGVEFLNLTNGGTAVINAAGITGATEIAVLTNTTQTTISNIAVGTAIGIGHRATDGDTDGIFVLSLADETGTADALTVNFNDTAGANTNTVNLKGTAIENYTFNFNTTDASLAGTTLTVSTLNASKITVAGSTADAGHVLALGTLDTETVTVDATGYAGVLTATASTSNTTMTVKGGAVVNTLAGGTGNDTFTVGSNTATQSIDAGAGTDTLNMTLGGTYAETNIDNFEVINYSVASSTAGVVTVAGGKGINDATTVTVSGGNSLSSFTATSTAIANAAMTSLDMSAFTGTTSVLLDGDTVLEASLNVKGGTGSDTVAFTYTEASVVTGLTATGLENLSLIVDDGSAADEAYSFDLTNVTAAKISLAEGNASAGDAITLTKLKDGQIVNLGGTNLQGTVTATLASATGTTDAVKFELADTNNASTTLALASAGVENVTITHAVTVAGGSTYENHSISLAGITATTGSHTAITMNGGAAANTVTVTAMSTSINSIDASAMSSALVLNVGNGGATAFTLTATDANDTAVYNNIADVINMGSGTDTLNVSLQSIGNSITVDMSVAAGADMISIAGAAGTVQSNFENVSLASFVGTGSNVTGSSAANTITGSAYTDSITGGEGADDITAGAGNDYITLTETTSLVDAVHMAGYAVDGWDTITGFVSGTDTFDFNSTLITGTAGQGKNTTGNAVAYAASAIEDVAANTAALTDSTAAIWWVAEQMTAGKTTVTDIIAEAALQLSDGAADFAANFTAGEGGLVIMDDGVNSYLFEYKADATNATTAAADLTLVATLVGVPDGDVLVAADFV